MRRRRINSHIDDACLIHEVQIWPLLQPSLPFRVTYLHAWVRLACGAGNTPDAPVLIRCITWVYSIVYSCPPGLDSAIARLLSL